MKKCYGFLFIIFYFFGEKKFYNYSFFQMSETLTSTEQEVYLVNIMSIAEDRLQSNFKAILKKLNQHDQIINQQRNNFNRFREQHMLEKIQKERIAKEQSQSLQRAIKQRLEEKIDIISKPLTDVQARIQKIQEKLKHNDQDRLEIKLQISEFRNVMGVQFGDISKSVRKIQEQIYKAFEEIYKKEDSTQALKLSKQIDMIKEKNSKFQYDSKLLQHKLEKIQILGERAERNQVKKETQLLNNVEEKIKKQIRQLHKGLNQVAAEISSREDLLRDENNPITGKSVHYKQNLKQRISLQPQSYDEQQSNMQAKPSLQRMAINKLNQKFSGFESKIKGLQQKLKSMQDTKKSKKKLEDEKMRDKIDEIKPELIKLWAKCDALDDRIVFSERRAEQRNKTINGLLENQKENNWSKMDEKLNLFQTQMYASLKQMKVKIQSKLKTSQFEKYCLNLEDRIKQITELIYLKSDKLQVKKALLFLQSKIKEIILVISEDQQQQKDALLTKKQLKCISCDKDVDKISKAISTTRGNWDSLPYKEHSPELLGRFGMTNFGSLSKKLKKLDSKDLPVLKKKSKNEQPDKQNA